MPASDLIIKGAREHNLRDVDVVLPRNRLICLTGVSGSGKSSLAFDTVYAEGQRRYVESLSTFARQYMGQMPKPDVDLIAGLSPSISISQKTAGNNPRSTVGTMTEIYDYLRVLYARVGESLCPTCGDPLAGQSREEILARILALPEGTRLLLLAPLIRGQKGEHLDLFEDLRKQGFARARVNGEVVSLAEPPALARQKKHTIEVVVDRLAVKPDARARLAEAVDLALKVGKRSMVAAIATESSDPGAEREAQSPKKPPRGRADSDLVFSMDYACVRCGTSYEAPSPQLFSFNSPQGMCSACDGLGELYTFDPVLLIPDPSYSLADGCIELLGPLKEMGRWKRHIYKGVADTMERKLGLKKNALLNTPWEDLDPEHAHLWLWGTGEEHITYTWRGGKSGYKYGGTFEGIIPDLLEQHRTAKSKPKLRQLEKFMSRIECHDCGGDRLNPQARAVRLTTAVKRATPALSLPDVCALPVSEAVDFFRKIELTETQQVIAAEALKEIRGRLGFLMNVGLDYLSLDRTAPTLSGGEAQRIRLAGQIGCGLVGVTYILDEPSIGLHPRDNDRLIDTMQQLRDQGNTVVVVEHDEDTMRAADEIIDFGPGPGVRGGRLVAQGPAQEVAKSQESVTGQFLAGTRRIAVPQERRPGKGQQVRVIGAAHNNLKGVDIEIPLGAFVCVTGVSGSGKSSFVNDILVEALRRDLNGGLGEPGQHERIEGLEHLDKLIAIDQTPIGRTPRSNPGTYIKVFDDIRKLFAQLPESKRRGFQPGRFSFNVAGGRCEACEGNGANKLEMDFLADVWVTCPSCNGKRFNHETLQATYKGKSIADVLESDIQQLLELFENQPAIRAKLQTLHDVGLDYLHLGQPSPTLSGGEAQRIKLARELVKRSTGQTLYLLDEPTTGLHFADIEMLLKVLHNFVEAGNTVLVVEHNLDVIKTADWLIDLGPEGGRGGGEIVVAGTPETVAKYAEEVDAGERQGPVSYTGRALAKLLKPARSPAKSKPAKGKRKAKTNGKLAKQITIQGASQHNLKTVDVAIDRDAMTVFCGPSGSGKSSLAMDTIYAEGQRRYVESLSSYARQFVAQMQKPAIEHAEGLSPAIAIEQKNLSHSPRSTVGTVTEVYDYLRILMARIGQPHCPECGDAVIGQTTDEVVEELLKFPEGTRLYLMAEVERQEKETAAALWERLLHTGYQRVRLNGRTQPLEGSPPKGLAKAEVEVVVDRVVVRPDARGRIADSVELALGLGRGTLRVAVAEPDVDEREWPRRRLSHHLMCPSCERMFEPLPPQSFSFNSPFGWCPSCEGLGVQTGTNPAALIRDGKLSIAEGGVAIWPPADEPLTRQMVAALEASGELDVHTPIDELSIPQRRQLLHGAGETWFNVPASDSVPGFRFQFKGLYPTLEEASRLSPTLRGKLEQFVDEVECSHCGGSRLRDDASAVRFRGQTIGEICRLPLGKLIETVDAWNLDARERKIAGELVREIAGRVQFLVDVGLEYLTLSRGAATLSGGEAQRIRLASQLGSGLCGVLYVLDEPTIGLHPRDNQRLIQAMHKLRDLGNTLLVVEHDKEVVASADRLCDFGPAAGRHGGEIVAQGTPKQVARKKPSVTGPYLSGKRSIPIPAQRRLRPFDSATDKARLPKPRRGNPAPKPPAAIRTDGNPQVDWLTVVGARHHNLRGVDAAFPLGALTAVTGPSGSGKSSLVNDVLYAALAKALHRASLTPGAHDGISGRTHINKVIRVDQQPLGNSPTSNPATYTGAFDLIRELFAQLPESKMRGFLPRRFSFNVPGGRCERCSGAGQICIEMHFLPDVWVTCEDCRGKRYNPETLEVTFRGRSISDVLEMTCRDALELFENIPAIRRILQTLCDVGLEYLALGQPAPTLSGGEAQRVKLASELARPDTGRTLYLLDEPTTGLHFTDLEKLLEVLQRLVDLGNSVVVIEHNLDVIKAADWVLDLGPDAGSEGGRLVAAGTPEQIVQYAETALRENLDRSHTGEALAPVLAESPRVSRKAVTFADLHEEREDDLDLDDLGEEVPMPWEEDGRQWHTRDRVGRKGEPVHWEGRILEHVVDRLQELGDFSPTDWGNRGVVEIAAKKKTDGWILHAITGEAWLIKLKFRTRGGTFERGELERDFPLPTLNQMHELPVYGNDPRIRVRNVSGGWQEIEFRLHQLREVDLEKFDAFLEKLVESFREATAGEKKLTIEEKTPWKTKGREWHFSRQGFIGRQRANWDRDVLERLVDLLEQASEGGQFLWNNKVLVHRYVNGSRSPWATICTKRPEGIELTLRGPRDRFTLGQIAELGEKPELIRRDEEDQDWLVLWFRTHEQLLDDRFQRLLADHSAAATNGA